MGREVGYLAQYKARVLGTKKWQPTSGLNATRAAQRFAERLPLKERGVNARGLHIELKEGKHVYRFAIAFEVRATFLRMKASK